MFLDLMHLIKSSLEMKWIMNRSEMAKSFNGNQEGKKRMRQVGSVEVPQEAFMAVLKVD